MLAPASLSAYELNARVQRLLISLGEPLTPGGLRVGVTAALPKDWAGATLPAAGRAGSRGAGQGSRGLPQGGDE
jgi:hypothetical protein